MRPFTYSMRIHHLLANVPDFLDYKDVLYVGGNRSRLQLVPELYWAGARITIVEIWPAYIEQLKVVNQDKHYFTEIIQGNVCKLQDAVGERQWPLAVWWHGPEHVDAEDLPGALQCLERAATALAVVGMPHGHCGQGVTKDGNIYQRHRTHWLPENLTALGWTAAAVKPEPGLDSHLIAWKRRA